MKTNRLHILENSLAKKEALYSKKIQQHFDTVKMANGQPLNDKRNGQATLNKWERQNNSIRDLQKSIEVTIRAIEREKGLIANVDASKCGLPNEILALIKSGDLIQWRKYPNRFFVNGVEKARIVWDAKKGMVSHMYIREIQDQEQWAKFREIFNSLSNSLNAK